MLARACSCVASGRAAGPPPADDAGAADDDARALEREGCEADGRLDLCGGVEMVTAGPDMLLLVGVGEASEELSSPFDDDDDGRHQQAYANHQRSSLSLRWSEFCALARLDRPFLVVQATAGPFLGPHLVKPLPSLGDHKVRLVITIILCLP